MDSVHVLDEIFPDRPPYMNIVEVIHPEIARYAEMHMNSKIKQIPWEEIYKIIKNNETSDDLYKIIQTKIVEFNESILPEININ